MTNMTDLHKHSKDNIEPWVCMFNSKKNTKNKNKSCNKMSELHIKGNLWNITLLTYWETLWICTLKEDAVCMSVAMELPINPRQEVS